MSLSFDTLRAANIARLPEFKNKHGGLAHSKPDGSDWSPGQWFEALIGELGEWAEQRLSLEKGDIAFGEYEQNSSKELADAQTYLDILARRSLDTMDEDEGVVTPDFQLMWLISAIGAAANIRKKLIRGDIDMDDYFSQVGPWVEEARRAIGFWYAQMVATPDKVSPVGTADPHGVDLGAATELKFNEVSRRVKSNVFITKHDRLVIAKDEYERAVFCYDSDPYNLHPCYD